MKFCLKIGSFSSKFMFNLSLLHRHVSVSDLLLHCDLVWESRERTREQIKRCYKQLLSSIIIYIHYEWLKCFIKGEQDVTYKALFILNSEPAACYFVFKGRTSSCSVSLPNMLRKMFFCTKCTKKCFYLRVGWDANATKKTLFRRTGLTMCAKNKFYYKFLHRPTWV